MNPTSQRLSALRKKMMAMNLDACIFLTSDPHRSEYLADHWQARRWLSGFTGTAGTLVVTREEAGLWSDGRYHIQAREQLAGTSVQLHPFGLEGIADWPQWLINQYSSGARIAVDDRTLPLMQAKTLMQAGLVLVSAQELLNDIWNDRPPVPTSGAFLHLVSHQGESSASKLTRLRAQMSTEGCDYQLLTSLDDVNWLTNLRGCDISYVPVVHAFALVGQEQAWLFIAPNKVSPELTQHLMEQGWTLADYDACGSRLSQLAAGQVLRLDPAIVNLALSEAIPTDTIRQEGPQLTTVMKAVKSDFELERMQHCLHQDGIAMVRFQRWLEQEVPGGNVTELSAENVLESLRKTLPDYRGPSFRTIAGSGPHGAMMHYGATPASDSSVTEHDFFLVDSGGQFLDGTTDITRTYHFGIPTDSERRDYTLALKGHLRLASARFKKGTRGGQLDVLARSPLWEHGIDYGCGTGHGVGFFLNVHEGPQSFCQKWLDQPLLPDMVITIEPGIYREGQYGIRIENIMVVKEADTTEFGTFYCMEPLTLAPIDTRPILVDMLSNKEKAWLNQYHALVYRELAPLLTPSEASWLELATRPI